MQELDPPAVTLPSRFKSIVARRAATILPGAPNALFARVIEDLGFEAAYVTGAGIANMHLGAPDIGLVTLTEISETVARISDAVALPLVVDADTGFGNPVNMVRTVRVLERAGAAAIQIEDQVFPKKCGHFAGKEVVPLPEMLAKIKAAVDTRRDQNLQIIARTDARAVLGLDQAIDRARAFVEAGADMIFIEAPLNEREIKRVATEIGVPQLVNIVHGGLTPALPLSTFKEMGFSIALFANAALQAALRASTEVLTALKNEGSLASVHDKLASFEQRQQSVNKPYYDQLEREYATEGLEGGAALKRTAS
jgi:2-methylisocitrate lyase-like PEP mutase family enzyme